MLTPDERAAMRQRHRSDMGHLLDGDSGVPVCPKCRTLWPCDAERLLDALDEAAPPTPAPSAEPPLPEPERPTMSSTGGPMFDGFGDVIIKAPLLNLTLDAAAPSPQPEPTGLVERVAEAIDRHHDEDVYLPRYPEDGSRCIDSAAARAAALAVADWLADPGSLWTTFSADLIRREVEGADRG